MRKNIFHGHISAFHGHFTTTHGHKFFTAIQDLKQPLFWKVAMITAIWQPWSSAQNIARSRHRTQCKVLDSSSCPCFVIL